MLLAMDSRTNVFVAQPCEHCKFICGTEIFHKWRGGQAFRNQEKIYFFKSAVQLLTSTSGVEAPSGYLAKTKCWPSGMGS